MMQQAARICVGCGTPWSRGFPSALSADRRGLFWSKHASFWCMQGGVFPSPCVSNQHGGGCDAGRYSRQWPTAGCSGCTALFLYSRLTCSGIRVAPWQRASRANVHVCLCNKVDSGWAPEAILRLVVSKSDQCSMRASCLRSIWHTVANVGQQYLLALQPCNATHASATPVCLPLLRSGTQQPHGPNYAALKLFVQIAVEGLETDKPRLSSKWSESQLNCAQLHIIVVFA